MLALIPGSKGGVPAAPIYLATDTTDGVLRVQVVAAPKADFAGSYTLEVLSNAQAGGNRAVHKGSANVRAGERAILTNVTVGNVVPGRWRARLQVMPSVGRPYEQSEPKEI